MGFQGRDKLGVVGSCGKAVLLFLPSFQNSTHRPLFLSFNAVACLTRMCFYSELDPDNSRFAGHRKGHFTTFVLQKPGPCQTSPCWYTEHTPLPQLKPQISQEEQHWVGFSPKGNFLALVPKFSAIPCHKFPIIFPGQWATMPLVSTATSTPRSLTVRCRDGSVLFMPEQTCWLCDVFIVALLFSPANWKCQGTFNL